MRTEDLRRLVWVSVFAVAFALVEAAVVIYLRALYYPGGFAFPLRAMPASHVAVELGREAATLVMLAAVGLIAGVDRWRRFAFFLAAFGVWDIFFYLWLKILVGWPVSLLDWDILFLLPIPWIGPVIAPLAIALMMTVYGAMIVLRPHALPPFRPGPAVWVLACAATGGILFSFMRDTPATMLGSMPAPYAYWLLCLCLCLYVLAMVLAWRPKKGDRPGIVREGRHVS
jgi:hypothetical protein